jgi:hypothetical protein
MWDPAVDMVAADAGGADVPCNLTMLPWVSDNRLHLTVFNRSHDIVWGAYGANAVHFSFVLEYLAARIGLPVGTMTFVSNNYHAYVETMPEVPDHALGWVDPYQMATGCVPWPLFGGWDEEDPRRERLLQEDLRVLFEHGPREAATKARWPYLRQVAAPMMLAHEHWRRGRGEDRYLGALSILQQVQATDWRLAATMWVERRYARWRAAADGSVPAEGERIDL